MAAWQGSSNNLKQKMLRVWLDVENKVKLFLEKSLFEGHQIGAVGYVDQREQGIAHS